MKRKRKAKNMAKIILLVLVLLTVLVTFLFIILKNVSNPKKNLEYMNSDEMARGTFSPKFIHIVVASYEGEVNPKAITKATYYFTTNLVPKYLKKCSNEEDSKKYYSENSEAIKIDIGIDNESEFLELMKEIQKLTPKLELESSTFKKDEIQVNKKNLEAVLYIKYQDNPEISVKTTISNKQYNNKTSVKFSK